MKHREKKKIGTSTEKMGNHTLAENRTSMKRPDIYIQKSLCLIVPVSSRESVFKLIL